jgi:hypothetical protein
LSSFFFLVFAMSVSRAMETLSPDKSPTPELSALVPLWESFGSSPVSTQSGQDVVICDPMVWRVGAYAVGELSKYARGAKHGSVFFGELGQSLKLVEGEELVEGDVCIFQGVSSGALGDRVLVPGCMGKELLICLKEGEHDIAQILKEGRCSVQTPSHPSEWADVPFVVCELVDVEKGEWKPKFKLWTGDMVEDVCFRAPKDGPTVVFGCLTNPLKDKLWKLVRVRYDNSMAALQEELEANATSCSKEETVKRHPVAQEEAELSVKRPKTEEGNFFRDLDGFLRRCVDKKNGDEIVREHLSGLYRLWPPEKVEEFLGGGIFKGEKIINRLREDNEMSDLLNDRNFVGCVGFPELQNMTVVKKVDKFTAYMTHQWPLQHRNVISLDDFTRDGQNLPLLPGSNAGFRDSLRQAIEGVARFERCFRSEAVAEVWESFAGLVGREFMSPFRYTEDEILVAAVECQWNVWAKRVYQTVGSVEEPWSDPKYCADRLHQQLDSVVALFASGVPENSPFSHRVFYSSTGYWSKIVGRKSGLDTYGHQGFVNKSMVRTNVTVNKPDGDFHCSYFLAGQLGLVDEAQRPFSCFRTDCKFKHDDKLSPAQMVMSLEAQDLAPLLQKAVDKHKNSK